MRLPSTAFESLKVHWAVEAISSEDLVRSESLVNERLAKYEVGNQIECEIAPEPEDESLLNRVALAYEIAAIEGLDELCQPAGQKESLRNQAIAASFRAFDIRRIARIPTETHERIYFILQLSSLAYCGDRWSDLRRWYEENQMVLDTPTIAEVTWDCRLLYQLFGCWIRLFRISGRDDLRRIRTIVAGLREDQRIYEAQCLNNGNPAKDRTIALQLITLYHWVGATEKLGEYMLQGRPVNPFEQIDMHFEMATKAAMASGHAQHEVVLRWLRTTARIMVTNSLWWTKRSTNQK